MTETSLKQSLFALRWLFFSILLDGFIMSYWVSNLDTKMGLMMPRTIIIMITILAFHNDARFTLFSTAFAGFIMDVYYLGFTGVYLSSFLLIAYITLQIRNVIHPNVLSYFLMSILNITIVEVIVFSIMKSLEITTFTFQMFIVSRLGATLLLNGVIVLMFGYFLHRKVNLVMDSERTSR